MNPDPTSPLFKNNFSLVPTCDLYVLDNYSFDKKELQKEKDSTVKDRLIRFREMYEIQGMIFYASCDLLLSNLKKKKSPFDFFSYFFDF